MSTRSGIFSWWMRGGGLNEAACSSDPRSVGMRIRRHETREALAFSYELTLRGCGEPCEWQHARDRVGLRPLDRPRPGAEPVDQHDGLDDRVIRVDRGPVRLAHHAIAVLVRDEELVVPRQEADGRRGVAARAWRARRVVERALVC